MRQLRAKSEIFKLLGLGLFLALASCGKNIKTSAGTLVEEVIPGASDRDGITPDSTGDAGNSDLRSCTEPVYNASESVLDDFLDPSNPVEEIRGPVTYCLEMSGQGHEAAEVFFRMEWEDKYAARCYPDHNCSGGPGQYDATSDKMELIWLRNDASGTEIFFRDVEGYVAIRGDIDPVDGLVHADLHYFNTPNNGFPVETLLYECRDSDYEDAGNNRLPGTYDNAGTKESCALNLRIPRNLYDSNLSTPSVLDFDWSDLQIENFLGILRESHDPANKAALETISIESNKIGELIFDNGN